MAVLLTYTPLTVFYSVNFSEAHNAKFLFERSSIINDARVHTSLDITFDGWNATISGIQEIELSLSSPTLLPFLIENSSILTMSIRRIEVYGAKAEVKGFYDGKYTFLLLNITPIENVQRIKLFYTSKYQPLLDINMRDPIEWHMKSTGEYFYLPPEAYMPIPKLRGNFTVKVTSYPRNYTLTGILKRDERKYKPVLPEEDMFHTDGRRLYILLGKWGLYEKSIKIDGRNVKVIAITDEGNVTKELAKIIRVYSSYLIPYPYDELIYIRFKGHRSEYEGYGLYGGALGTQFSKVIPHEVAHNWFAMYANLGILNEPFTVYTSSLYSLNPEQLDKWEALCLSSKDETPISEIRSVNRNQFINLYYRGGFALRSLQFIVGNETFFKGLIELLEVCHVKDCTETYETLDLIREIFENMSNQDLGWFFKEWFYSAKYPDFTVSELKLTQSGSHYLLTLNISENNGFAMPLEAEIITPKENITERIFVNGSAVLRVETEGKPLMVILDPNDWIVNVNGSAYRINRENLTFEKTGRKEKDINGVKIIIN